MEKKVIEVLVVFLCGGIMKVDGVVEYNGNDCIWVSPLTKY